MIVDGPRTALPGTSISRPARIWSAPPRARRPSPRPAPPRSKNSAIPLSQSQIWAQLRRRNAPRNPIPNRQSAASGERRGPPYGRSPCAAGELRAQAPARASRARGTPPLRTALPFGLQGSSSGYRARQRPGSSSSTGSTTFASSAVAISISFAFYRGALGWRALRAGGGAGSVEPVTSGTGTPITVRSTVTCLFLRPHRPFSARRQPACAGPF